mgnify:CR=1 FL=1
MTAKSGHQVFIADFPPNLGFKANAGEHYMIIDSYESKNAIESQGSKLSSIGLYIPAGSLTTSYTGNYEAKEGARQAAEAMSGLSSDDSLWKKIVDAANIGGSKIFSKAAIQSDQATGFFSAQGETPNNHMALVYRGPNTFRQHTFAFKFFPKNSAESKTVQSIITELKFGTLPRMSGSSGTIKEPFFKSPRHHEINFYQGGTGASGRQGVNTKLFSIGKSVISNLVLNYDPQSVVSFHNDGSPVQIDMTITFQEIELQINTKDSTGQGRDALADAVAQNQSTSQTTAEQQRVQEVFLDQDAGPGPG